MFKTGDKVWVVESDLERGLCWPPIQKVIVMVAGNDENATYVVKHLSPDHPKDLKIPRTMIASRSKNVFENYADAKRYCLETCEQISKDLTMKIEAIMRTCLACDKVENEAEV